MNGLHKIDDAPSVPMVTAVSTPFCCAARALMRRGLALRPQVQLLEGLALARRGRAHRATADDRRTIGQRLTAWRTKNRLRPEGQAAYLDRGRYRCLKWHPDGGTARVGKFRHHHGAGPQVPRRAERCEPGPRR
jgi:hypothetical protein